MREKKLFPHPKGIKDSGNEVFIDLFHGGDQIQYSFVSMLLSLSSLTAMGKLQKNIYTNVRRVGIIYSYTKGITNTQPFIKVAHYFCFHEEYFSTEYFKLIFTNVACVPLQASSLMACMS